MSFVLYSFLPNPYEFTHLPEYAILSILIMRELDKNIGKGRNPSRENRQIIGNIGSGKDKKENVKSVIIKN